MIRALRRWLRGTPAEPEKRPVHTIVLHRADTRLRDGAGHGHWYHLNGPRDDFDAYLPDTLTRDAVTRDTATRVRITVEALPPEGDDFLGYCGFCGTDCAALHPRPAREPIFTLPAGFRPAPTPVLHRDDLTPDRCGRNEACVLGPHDDLMLCRTHTGHWLP